MKKNRIRKLLNEYFVDRCTEEEILELNEWYEQLGLDNRNVLPDKVLKDKDQYLDERYKVLTEIIDKQANRNNKRIFLKVAAVLFIFIGIGLFMYLHNRTAFRPTVSINQTIGVPGSNGAVLTLANGQKVVLADSAKGSVALQGNAQVINDSGELSYRSVNNNNSVEVVYNTLSTPRGKQYTLILPDGTKAMLNAASLIKYPTAFTGNKREVEVAGEVYFEVRHNESLPFIVKSGSTTIRDIGTHFDIMNYPDEEDTKTTLLEGAVTVEANSFSKKLQPGEQAVVTDNKEIKVRYLPDADDVIAWTKGIIDFNSVDIATLLKQLGRWYNVDIVYKTDIPKGHISGGIPRNTEMRLIIKALNAAGVTCHMQGKQLVVTQ